MKPQVTVLIDTYNYGRFIDDAIESVLKQDVPADQVEIVVIDDGSTDDTPDRVRKYGTKIRYFRKQNGGQASAFNFGFAQARGEIIALLDADDYFLPHKLASVLAEFEAHPEVGMAYHRLLHLNTRSGSLSEGELIDESGNIANDESKMEKLIRCQTSCLAFRRTLISQFLPIPESIRLQADTYLVLLAALVAPVLALPESLGVYRIHGQNLFYADSSDAVANRTSRQLSMFLTICTAVRSWLEKNPRYNQRRARLYLQTLICLCEENMFPFHPPGRFRLFWFLLKQNYVSRTRQTWRFTAYQYLAAFSALVFGFETGGAMYERRRKTLERVQSMFPRFLRGKNIRANTEG